MVDPTAAGVVRFRAESFVCRVLRRKDCLRPAPGRSCWKRHRPRLVRAHLISAAKKLTQGNLHTKTHTIALCGRKQNPCIAHGSCAGDSSFGCRSSVTCSPRGRRRVRPSFPCARARRSFVSGRVQKQVEPVSWLCEAALFVRWVHVGTVEAVRRPRVGKQGLESEVKGRVFRRTRPECGSLTSDQEEIRRHRHHASLRSRTGPDGSGCPVKNRVKPCCEQTKNMLPAYAARRSSLLMRRGHRVCCAR